MLNRVFICVWFTCIVLASSIHSAECKSISLYSSNNPSPGFLTNSSFPENPEWQANWGKLGEMEPPYIRFSGQHNQTKNWKAVISFPQMPFYVSSGFLELKVRATQKVQIKIVLEQAENNGLAYTTSINANQTHKLEIPISSLLSKSSLIVKGVSIELIQIPANQYTTLFLDDISFSCTSTTPITNTVLKSSDTLFVFSETIAEKAARTPLDTGAMPISYALKKHSDSAQIVLRSLSENQIVMTENEHHILQAKVLEKPSSPKQSWKSWNECLYYINKNRLNDSLFANPKVLFREANNFSASYNYQVIPILVGLFNYDYYLCNQKNSDSICIQKHLESSKIMVSGFSSSFIYGSKVEFILDPYFITTNQKTMPEIELFLHNQWVSLKIRSRITHSFDSLGLHSIPVKLYHGSDIIETTLLLEVR